MNAEQDPDTTRDLAVDLIAEFVGWFQSLGAKGVVPRAFTGVTTEGKQAVIILSDLPLDHVQRQRFLIWLCRHEAFVGYAYATRVGIANNSGMDISEALDIYASSAAYDGLKTLLIQPDGEGKIRLSNHSEGLLSPETYNGAFLGLQRSKEVISSQDQELFAGLWGELKPNAMWRQR
jgi:hypothetical protein